MSATAAERPGFLRRCWRLLDASRRATMNLLFLLVLIALFAALVAYLMRGPAALKDNTALVLDLNGALVEQRSGSLRERVRSQASGEPDGQVQLRDVLAVLDAAAKDPKIARAVLVLDDFRGGGLASLREVAAAIERFKAAGKPVIAWGSAYDQKSYFIAAHASEVLLHPMGMVYVDGFGRLRNYYREAFDRLGVSANVIRVGKYKNFGEPFFASGPSKETLESDAYLYDALWATWTGAVEQARKMPAGSIAKGIENLPQGVQPRRGRPGPAGARRQVGRPARHPRPVARPPGQGRRGRQGQAQLRAGRLRRLPARASSRRPRATPSA